MHWKKNFFSHYDEHTANTAADRRGVEQKESKRGLFQEIYRDECCSQAPEDLWHRAIEAETVSKSCDQLCITVTHLLLRPCLKMYSPQHPFGALCQGSVRNSPVSYPYVNIHTVAYVCLHKFLVCHRLITAKLQRSAGPNDNAMLMQRARVVPPWNETNSETKTSRWSRVAYFHLYRTRVSNRSCTSEALSKLKIRCSRGGIIMA